MLITLFDNLKSLLSFEINSSEGGKESNSCATILYKMYIKFFEKNQITYKLEHFDENSYGINKAIFTIEVKKDLFDKIINESGNHRFVRKSPFSKQNKLHTSFVKVSVYEKSKSKTIELKDKDISIKFFKGTGAGGQHRNKVETGVRLTHIPTGIVSEAVSERSQKQNREIAYLKLKERVQNIEDEKFINNKSYKWANSENNGFGSKRRTYKIEESTIKDEISGESYHNISKIINGDIEQILS